MFQSSERKLTLYWDGKETALCLCENYEIEGIQKQDRLWGYYYLPFESGEDAYQEALGIVLKAIEQAVSLNVDSPSVKSDN